MSRLFVTFLVFLALVPRLHAGELLQGRFNVVNTEGFVQEDGRRMPLATDTNVGLAMIEHGSDGGLAVTIAETRIQLFPLENGLAGLDWDAGGTALLHATDIQALLDKAGRDEVPAWGAELAWPGLGATRLVLFPLGETAYTGFLISHPGDRTVVRQMEFRQVFGPSNRPASGSVNKNKGS